MEYIVIGICIIRYYDTTAPLGTTPAEHTPGHFVLE